MSEDETSQLLSLAWESLRHECVGSEGGNPSTHMTDTMYNDLGLVSAMHQHSGVSKADDTQNSRGWIAHP